MSRTSPNSNPSPAPSETKFGRLFISFASRDFRFVWSYYVLNFLGMSMEMLAQGWLVLIVTDSPFWVGGVAGLRGAGQVGFGILGGVIADRFNRRIVLTVAQVIRAAIFLWLGLLIVSDGVELWHLLTAALLQGMLMAIVLPASEALVYDTVGPKRLLNAVAIKHGAFSLARIPGSLLAGVLIATTGVGSCYLVITGILLVSPLPILLMRTQYLRPPAYESVWQNLKGGLSYAAKNNSLRSLLLFSTVVEMFGFSYFIMLPVIARDVLHVGASGLGFLAAAGSVGGLVATVVLASLTDIKAKFLMLTLSGVGVGTFLLFFGLSPWYATSLVMAGLVGVALVAYDITMGTTLQLLSTDAMRGRILGLYGLTFGFTPVGGFVGGVVATVLSAPFAVGMGGVVILAFVAIILLPNKSLKESLKPAAFRAEGPAKSS